MQQYMPSDDDIFSCLQAQVPAKSFIHEDIVPEENEEEPQNLFQKIPDFQSHLSQIGKLEQKMQEPSSMINTKEKMKNKVRRSNERSKKIGNSKLTQLENMFQNYEDEFQNENKRDVFLNILSKKTKMSKTTILEKHKDFKQYGTLFVQKKKRTLTQLNRLIQQNIHSNYFKTVKDFCLYFNHKYNQSLTTKKMSKLLSDNNFQIDQQGNIDNTLSQNEKCNNSLKQILTDIFYLDKLVLFFGHKIIPISHDTVICLSVVISQNQLQYQVKELHQYQPQKVLMELVDRFSLQYNWMLVIGIQEIYQLRSDCHIDRAYYVRKSCEIQKNIILRKGKLFCLPFDSSYLNPANHYLELMLPQNNMLNLKEIDTRVNELRMNHSDNFRKIVKKIEPNSQIFIPFKVQPALLTQIKLQQTQK